MAECGAVQGFCTTQILAAKGNSMAKQAVTTVVVTSVEPYMGLVALDEVAHHTNAKCYTNAAYQAER